jgi:nitroreductase
MSNTAAEVVLSYHTRSKHALDKYAAGPGTLDWDAQPDPFRTWTGCESVRLPREVNAQSIAWHAIQNARGPSTVDLDNLASLLRLSVGLTAWKEYAGSRWSLRAHPSSGNLHPTETWLIASGVTGLDDGLYHYLSRDHELERRAWGGGPGMNGVWIGFSSIHWREAWKYGERAFRYCQLDLGHVLAAICYAAALHGWKPRLLSASSTDVARLLGLDRKDDYANVEAEDPEVLLVLNASHDEQLSVASWQHWSGTPNLLDPRPLYTWPVIDEVAAATHGATPQPDDISVATGSLIPDDRSIAVSQAILQRRSAQAFDGTSVMPLIAFRRMLAALLPGGSPVWKLWSEIPRVHPVMLVHRIDGITPGVYMLPRSKGAVKDMKLSMRDVFSWQEIDAELPLFQLISARSEKVARTLSCHQDIASRCAVTFLMLAEFAAPIRSNPVAYRHLHWEAGMLGHVLSLEAEASGWRGTGIGCFFDDADHEVLGLQDDKYQVIYHFAIGKAVDDPRLLTLPAYE